MFCFYNTAMTWLWIWLGIVIISLIVELATVGLTSIWMAGGGLVSLIFAAIGAPVWLQVVAFFVSTGVLLVFTRPLAVKYLNRKRTNTNVDALRGKIVRIIERVDNEKETGKAYVNGMEWTARSDIYEETFEVDEMAEVVDISGVKLILKKHINT